MTCISDQGRHEGLYLEEFRPQFHFTAKRNWLNDPNGLVYYEGEYHLFFQHNPTGIAWGNMTWGHAVSADLVRWRQLENSLEPDSYGTMFSGSAVVDWRNTSGLQRGQNAPLVAIYTAAGDTSPESHDKPFTQCVATSADRGRKWNKYPGNPVLPNLVGGNRDPKVVWHAPSNRWIMALYLEGEEFALFASTNLKKWDLLQKLNIPGGGECPDFFEMSIAGRPGLRDNSRWIFTAADGRYLIGAFDGTRFEPETGSIVSDRGANFYAVQTYSDAPDGRRIQIAWMRGGDYPGMPFNQQMSFPCDLTLRDTPEGLRLYRSPVPEIESLYERESRWVDLPIEPGANPLRGLSGDLWDIYSEIECGDASVAGLMVRGEQIRYDVHRATVTCLGRSGPLPLEQGRIRLRILVDRTSIELFGNGGALSMTSCFLPASEDFGLSLFAEGGAAVLTSLRVTALKSAWSPSKGR